MPKRNAEEMGAGGDKRPRFSSGDSEIIESEERH
jgi:hypothetical protein